MSSSTQLKLKLKLAYLNQFFPFSSISNQRCVYIESSWVFKCICCTTCKATFGPHSRAFHLPRSSYATPEMFPSGVRGTSKTIPSRQTTCRVYGQKHTEKEWALILSTPVKLRHIHFPNKLFCPKQLCGFRYLLICRVGASLTQTKAQRAS